MRTHRTKQIRRQLAGLFFVFIPLLHYGQVTQLQLQSDFFSVDTVELKRCRTYNIESMTSTSYSYSFGQRSETGKVFQTRKYDESGNLILIYGDDWKNSFSYDKNGNRREALEYPYGNGLGRKILMSYDTLGRMIEKKDCDWSGNLRSRTIFSYDNFSNVTESKSYNQDNSYYFHKYEYSGGFLAKEMYGSVNGATSLTFSTKIFTFNPQGKILSVVEGNETTIYTYDSLGQLISESRKTPQVVENTKKYKYDSRGNRIYESEDGIDYKGKPIKEIFYKFDLNNRIIESNSSKWGKSAYQYGANGLLESLISYDAGGNPTSEIRYTYTFY